MAKAKNVLWIMADQLRWDYLSCYGHPHLHTPHIDALAKRGVQFNRAYVQAPICGASRMSYYTGRYTRSHGATWNFFPLRIGEPTLGDHLKRIGVRNVLAGKTHMIADVEGMKWLGIDPNSPIGVHISQCGFQPFDRDDGLHTTLHDRGTHYDKYLADLGYEAEIPWHDWANAHDGDDGEILSGWLIKNNDRAARIPEEHSETAYMTNRAMEFMRTAGDDPWCLHLSYIKPHWPYCAPAPYHDMYGPETWLPFNRSEAEKVDANPVYDAFMNQPVCKAFSETRVRDALMGAYMGLIKQIDDHLGRLFAFMDEQGLSENTMIVFCSDHGDNLGDHWMGEKDLFHDCSVRVPMIIADPSPEADATRGTVSEALVEGIDLAPTFVEYFGGRDLPHILEGKSLMPVLAGKTDGVRDWAISEYDYSTREARKILGQDVMDCRLIMCVDQRWKFWHTEGYRPMLFDLETDPDELVDLGLSDDPAHVRIRALMHERIFEWARRHHNRITRRPEEVLAIDGGEPPGIIIGVYDEDAYEVRMGHPFSTRP
jgi:arylsulfatase A-like enzyme